jgi:hypothetical protein
VFTLIAALPSWRARATEVVETCAGVDRQVAVWRGQQDARPFDQFADLGQTLPGGGTGRTQFRQPLGRHAA